MKKLTAKQIREFLPKMAFNKLLGMRLAAVHKDGVTVEVAIRPEMMNGAGVLHGGVTATMADAAAGIATNREVGGRPITTVELKINYFRPVTKGYVRARAHLIRVGSTLVISRVDLTDADKNLIGTALVTYIILGAR
ncbi:MAG TPA: PaaI family thioesterase [Bryobacteraceae bacterium]|nr:PaaI family thioesterase [Bryobacteraceae bacterium]